MSTELQNGKLEGAAAEKALSEAKDVPPPAPSKVHPATNRELFRSTLTVIGGVASLCGLLVAGYLKVISAAEAKSVEAMAGQKAAFEKHVKDSETVAGHLHSEQLETRRDVKAVYFLMASGQKSERMMMPIEDHQLDGGF